MTADIRALAQQLTDIQLRGVGKEIRDDEAFTGVRGSMLAALHTAIAQAANLAYLVLQFDDQHPCCGCGEASIGRDATGAPICAGCRALEAAALEELAAVEQGAWDDQAVRRSVLKSIPIQPEGTDR